MKLAVVSDIHGNLAALQAVLQDIARRGADAIVNLGDLLSGPLQPAETADLLMARPLVTVSGNHERQLLAILDRHGDIDSGTSDGFAASQVTDAHARWLRSLPATHWYAPGVLLVHGTPASDLDYWLETVTPDADRDGAPGVRAATADEARARLESAEDAPSASLVLCGHTHVPRAMQVGGTLVVNPGSVGLQAYDDTHPHDHRIETGAPHARYAMVEQAGRHWCAHLLAVPYDWEAQARLAAARGRGDWAYALATGRMPPRASTIAA